MARGVFTNSNYFTHKGFTTTAGQKLAFSIWIKCPSAIYNCVAMGYRNGDSGAGNFTQIKIEDNGGSTKAIFIHDQLDKGSSFSISTSVVDDNTWKHVFGYYNGTRMRVYVNGAYEADNGGDKTTNIVNAGSAWAIGRRNDSASESFDGYVKNAAIWIGRTFTDQEVADLASGAATPLSYPDGLKMYQSLDKKNLNDLSTGNLRHLTEVGTVGMTANASVITTTQGLLTVHATNPRYFDDGSGKPLLLVGLHNWSNIQDRGNTDPPSAFDNATYLDTMQANNCNFIRGWMLEEPRRSDPTSQWKNPIPWARTGPGNAADGKLKFNLTQFDQNYFDRIRSRVIAAGDRGMYFSVMLFQGWSVYNHAPGGTDYGFESDPWPYHPFNSANNINSIDGDINDNGNAIELHTLADSAVTALQEAYIEKVIDTVNDLNNVIYEISNESFSTGADNIAWHNHMIDHIQTYEGTLAKQHLVWFTTDIQGNYLTEQKAGNAEIISPSQQGETTDYLDNPPVNDGTKIVITDSDHVFGVGGTQVWAWKCFIRGNHPMYMDPLGSPSSDAVAFRYSMGYIKAWADRINLRGMTPQNALSNTGYCLAKTTAPAEYLVYAPSGGSFTIDLSAVSGSMNVEWFNPTTGQPWIMGGVQGGASRTFVTPFSGDSVAYVTQGARRKDSSLSFFNN